MRAAAALLLAWSVAAGQRPGQVFTVVVLPTAIRDSMSALWSESNRYWDYVPDVRTPNQVMSVSRPTRAYLGCLTGNAAGDTLWVRHFVPATDVKRREFSATGDCSKVVDLIGTWHTHPYRAGYNGEPIKERGLSGRDFKIFAAAADLITIVLWDVDSLDVAAKGPDGQVLEPFPYVIR